MVFVGFKVDMWDKMKITKEESENGPNATNAKPLDLFWQGVGAEAIRTVYTRMLQRILCDIPEDVLEGIFEQRAAQFVRLGAPSLDAGSASCCGCCCGCS